MSDQYSSGVSLEDVLQVKIVATMVAWSIPLILPLPAFVHSILGLPEPSIFTKLLGVAYLALCVGYYKGLGDVRSGVRPTQTIYVGIVSNGGACVMILSNWLGGAMSDLGYIGQFYFLVSAAITGVIAYLLPTSDHRSPGQLDLLNFPEYEKYLDIPPKKHLRRSWPRHM
eukprot:Clim_evm43s204 gene=Clim_evmTU43s204